MSVSSEGRTSLYEPWYKTLMYPVLSVCLSIQRCASDGELHVWTVSVCSLMYVYMVLLDGEADGDKNSEECI